MKAYTTSDVSGLLGLTPRQIRAYARAGNLTPARGPRGEYLFGFQDLVVLRTAAALVHARVPSRRIESALRRLRLQLPEGRSLTELRITADGDDIIVHDGGATWNPESGQLVLDFRVAEFAAEVAPLAQRVAAEAQATPDSDYSAVDWYQLGIELEAVAPAEAMDAYRRALILEPRFADAHVNLGRLLHEAGQAVHAAAQYQAALVVAPRHAVAAYNLGVALEDLGQPDEAVAAYERSLAADDTFADAHYNVARLYEKRGDAQAALRHYSAYRQATGGKHQ